MPLSKFSAEQITQLESEFHQLQAIEHKFTFWHTKLGMGYSQVGVKVGTDNVRQFLIHAKSREEIEELNVLVLEEARFYRDIVKTSNSRKGSFYFDKEKKSLDYKLKEVINPMPILTREKDWIEEEVKKHCASPAKNVDEFREGHTNSFWLFGYDEYYTKGKEPDLGNRLFSAPVLLALMDGFEVAQFRAYLDKLEWEYSQKRVSVTHEETSRKQQLLILYHTGMLDKLNHLPAKDRNKLLSVLLNRSETNIRLELNKIHKKGRTNSIRNEENLSFLLSLLNETGFESEAEKIKNELEELR